MPSSPRPDVLEGGLAGYVETAQKLLKDSAEGVNPFSGFQPQIPAGEKLQVKSLLEGWWGLTS